MASDLFLKGVVNGNEIFVGAGATDGSGGGGNIPVGSIIQTIVATAPAGWLLCDGSIKNTADYPALAAALGETGETFALPDFRGRTIWGANSDYAVKSVIPAGLPDHRHTVTVDAPTAFTGGSMGTTDWQNLTSKSYSTSLASSSNSIYGKSDTVQPPAIAVNVIIKF